MSDGTAAERMRRYRKRKKATAASPIFYEQPDWRDFINCASLPRKAGCDPDQLGHVILKELVDNALDAGGVDVTLKGDERRCTVSDDGPGIAPDQVPRLFAVNRPRVSSKIKRLPTRGMLGNGLRVVMGAVAALGGTISVTTRRCRYYLGTNTVTGETEIRSAADAPTGSGVVVVVEFPRPTFSDDDYSFARQAIRIGRIGKIYHGPSMPSWYGETGLGAVLAAAPKDRTRDDVLLDLFGTTAPVDVPVDIGELGESTFNGYYRKVQSTATIEGATIPFTIEAWVDCEPGENDDNTHFYWHPLINRSLALAKLTWHADSQGLRLDGCGLDFKVSGAKRAEYTIHISLITPYLQLTGDGKAPYLADFKEAIIKAVTGAANKAYRRMTRPRTAMSIKDAAYAVMKDAYLKASDNGTLPAKARQIMYAARGDILQLTGKKKFDDKRFTQELLPDYITEHPEETADWDVVYDARGNLIEPHTNRRIPLGTLQVRQYLGDRPALGPAAQMVANTLYPTSGPKNRYRNILFVEKEGFDELFAAVQLAERYDVAPMSTKGMSVVAARQLLDRLADDVDNVFVLHDLDVSGFSIVGTLGTDSRRYKFANEVPIVDIGMQLDDIEAMGLEAEAVKVENITARRKTLEERGATEAEIEFLTEPDDEGMCRRVELNAMTSRQLVDLVEAKLQEHGVEKVVPEDGVLVQHARRLVEQRLVEQAITRISNELTEQAATVDLPGDLRERIDVFLEENPELPWDEALARIISGENAPEPGRTLPDESAPKEAN
jgi:hypothetical protein